MYEAEHCMCIGGGIGLVEGGGGRRDGCCGGGLSRAGYVITARIQILFTCLNCSSTALLYNPPVPIAD